MPLRPGSRLGPYAIVAPLGSGGMGEVYKASDTRLNRTVAIKLLPPELGVDQERRQRFEREARLIASLNHPNICAVHDVGSEATEGSTLSYLVMEHLDGETLADRLRRGPLPIDDAIRIGADIASALAAAHRERIVHRDLKPGNVMLTKTAGRGATHVKLLDFGIAKTLQPAAGGLLSTKELTVATAPGTTPGTLPYMSPEQLEGRGVDARSDLFALGAVLFEMATGRRAFAGESYAAVASAIMTAAPPAIEESPSLDRIVKGCLEKDPEQRWQSAQDVARQLQALGSTDAVARPASRRRHPAWLPWAIALAAVAIAAAVAWMAAGRAGSAPAASLDKVVTFPIPPPNDRDGFLYNVEYTSLAVSPDGSQVAFSTITRGAQTKLWVRPLASLEARAIEGTEGSTSMFWSPDGRSLAFFAAGKLKRVDLTGGARPIAICDVRRGIGQMGTWSDDGTILFASVQGEEILQVRASGGTPSSYLKPDPSRGETRVTAPVFLPDGRSVLFMAGLADDKGAIMLAQPGSPPRELMRVKSNVQYVQPGFLLFAQDGALLARPFDLATGQIGGDPIPVADPVSYFWSTGFGQFSASRDGVIAFQSHQNLSRIAWFGRSGADLGSVRPTATYQNLRLSKNLQQLMFDRADPRTTTFDVFVLELDRGAETQITNEPGTEVAPIWAPDDTLIYSTAKGRPPRLHRRGFHAGTAAPIGPDAFGLQQPTDISPDGQWLLYMQRTTRGDFDLNALRLADGKVVPLRDSDLNETDGRFSPDGKHVAFVSTEGGVGNVYLMPFLSPGARRAISTTGGSVPRWSRDGRELFYVSIGDDSAEVMTVPIRRSPALEIGKASPLFPLAPGRRWADFAPMPDGRFLAIHHVQFAGQQPVTVIANWPASLPAR